MERSRFRAGDLSYVVERVRLIGSALLVSAVISGCGGGGSSTSPPPPPSLTFSIGGSLVGLATGAQVILLDNGTGATTLTANGSFQLSTAIASGGSYSVTVQAQPAGQVCTVTGGSGTNVTGNVASIAVVCTNSSTASYTWKAPTTQYVGTIQSPSIASLGNGSLVGAFVGTQVNVILGNFATNSWAAPTPLSTPIGVPTGYVLVLANGTAGNAVVAWTSQVSGSTNYAVWTSSYKASAQAWSTPVQTGTASSPQIRGGGSLSGYTVFGWLQPSTAVPGSTALGLWELSPSGAVVATTELETGTVPAATIDIGANSTGTVSVAWAGTAQVQLAISGTSLWTSPASLGASSSVTTSGDISLAVDATQGDAVAWSGADALIHAVFYSSSGVLNASSTLSVTGAVNSLPSIASAGGGAFALIFAASTAGASGNFGYSSKYSPLAASFGALLPIGQIGWGASHLMVDANGDAVVVNHIGVGDEAGYSLPDGTSVWTGGNLDYNVPPSASTMEFATGRVATLWSNTASSTQAGISSDFFD